MGDGTERDSTLLFALPAIGAVLSPAAMCILRRGTPVRRAVLSVIGGISRLRAGVGWLAVGALSYYTHIAMSFGLRDMA